MEMPTYSAREWALLALKVSDGSRKRAKRAIYMYASKNEIDARRAEAAVIWVDCFQNTVQ